MEAQIPAQKLIFIIYSFVRSFLPWIHVGTYTFDPNLNSWKKKSRYIVYQVIVAASKIGLSEHRLRVYEQITPRERFQSPNIYSTYSHFVLNSRMISLTNENKVLL